MNFSSASVIRGLRIAIPYVLALIAPLVMAERYAQAYKRIWDELPAVSAMLIRYGLYLREQLWIAVVLGAIVIVIFQAISAHPRLGEAAERAFMALHLTGIFAALLVIFLIHMPAASGRFG